MRQLRNFEERRLFDIENPREFREKLRLPVDAFVHLLELIARVWNETQQTTNGKTTTFSISSLSCDKFLLPRNALLSWYIHINSMAYHSSRCPCNILFVSSKRRRLEARNFAVIFIFIPFTTYEKTSFAE